MRPLRKLARELRPTAHLRPDRPRARGNARCPELRARPDAPIKTKDGPVRVRDYPREPRASPLVGAILPDGDAVHHLRRRGDLLLSMGGAPAPAEVVWPHRDAGLHGNPPGRPRPHLAQGRPGLGVEELVAS